MTDPEKKLSEKQRSRGNFVGTSLFTTEGETIIKLKINGQLKTLEIEPRVTLLDALRETLGLTGSKKGCDHGQCGACTVLIDGQRVYSCLTLAIMQEDKEITTIEGLAENGKLHPMQEAFKKHHGLQCGYCTPGMVMSAVDLLKNKKNPSDKEIREWLEGNICRCTGYQNIVAAVKDAASKM